MMHDKGQQIVSSLEVEKHQIDNPVKLKFVQYTQDGKKLLCVNGSMPMTSSHYFCSYRVDVVRNFIEFNFSIPKMIYGTNILQFIKHHTEAGFLNTFHSDYHNVALETFERFGKFIKRFFFKLTAGQMNEVFPELIEVRRIDICYNQIFLTEKDALTYLEYQKRIKKKGLRALATKAHIFEDAIFIQTGNYVAKIYQLRLHLDFIKILDGIYIKDFAENEYPNISPFISNMCITIALKIY